MFQRILVPLDGSPGAERAIPVALRIARASSAELVFLRVILPEIEFGAYAIKSPGTLEPKAFEKELQDANDYLANLLRIHADELQHIKTEQEVISGAVSPSIFSVARLEHVDLIVMCSHGETGLKRWLFGSGLHDAVRHSPAPMLILNEHGEIPTAPGMTHPFRVLVALDGSERAEAALEPAARLCATFAAPARGGLHLVRVVAMPSPYGKLRGQMSSDVLMRNDAWHEAETYLQETAHKLQAGELSTLNVDVTWSVVVKTDADVAGSIMVAAEQIDEDDKTSLCNMLAMASHGRGGLQRLLMGSVTERLLGATRLPLFIVRLPSPPEPVHKQTAAKDEQTEKATEQPPAWVGLL